MQVKIWFQNRRAKCRRIAEARTDRVRLLAAAAGLYATGAGDKEFDVTSTTMSVTSPKSGLHQLTNGFNVVELLERPSDVNTEHRTTCLRCETRAHSDVVR